MSTNAAIKKLAVAGAAMLCVLGTAATAADDGAAAERKSISRHHITGGRVDPTSVKETTEDYSALEQSGVRQSPSRATAAKGESQAQKGNANDFWFFEADVVLFNDDDNDGYFHGLDVLFDADTLHIAADVYAVLYLSFEGGPWNEYAVTEDFTIFGQSGDDEYVIVTELMTGYPTGSYDLLIELYDTFDNAFLAEYGPIDTSELSFLPLEDFNRDAPVTEVVVVSEGGGGAFDGFLIVALLMVLVTGAIRKIWARRHHALTRIDTPSHYWQDN